MFRVTVNNHDTLAAARDAEEELKNLPQRMLNAARMGAEYEKANKTYEDRTGNLRKHTVGRLVRRGLNEVVAEIEMGEEYASYVRARGFSAFNEAVKLTRQTIEDEIDLIGQKITG